jgi:hypothetical protein
MSVAIRHHDVRTVVWQGQRANRCPDEQAFQAGYMRREFLAGGKKTFALATHRAGPCDEPMRGMRVHG